MYRLTRFTLENRALVGAILAGVTLFLALGVPKVQVVHGFRVLIGEDHPVVETLDSMTERFGGSRPFEIGWRCGEAWPCANALDESSLAVAEHLTRSFEALPFVRRVYSPSNTAVLVPDEGGFTTRRLVEEGSTAPDLERLAKLARDDIVWKRRLISEDLSAAILIVAPRDATVETEDALYDAVAPLLRPFEDQGFVFSLNGALVRTILSGRALENSTARIIPLLIGVIGVVLFWTSRSIQNVVLSLLTMGIAVLWAQGLMGWAGWPQDGIHQVLAPLIVIVGVCDAVHLLARADELSGQIAERLLIASRDVGAPCVVTTATSAVALASFTTSDLEAFIRFGMISSLGVSACLLLTFSLLPLLASLSPLKNQQPAQWTAPGSLSSTKLSRASLDHPRTVLLACTFLLLGGSAGIIARLRVDTDFRQAFGETGELSRWAGFFESVRGTSDTLEIDVEIPRGMDIYSDSVLATIGLLSARLELLPGLGESFSLLDLLRRLDQALAGESQNSSQSTIDSHRAAELVELISFDDPASLEPWVTLDRRAARLSIEAHWLPQSQSRPLMEAVRAAIAETTPPDWIVRLGGIMALDDVWVTDVQSTQLRSFPTAFLLVFALSAMFLRSVWLGLIAMVPSVLAIAVTLGTMGWLGMGLDIGRAMIGAVVIGIGVDDAIHFLDAYRKQLARGGSREEAIEFAVGHTGRAIVTTSLALAFGFLTLMASAWQTISSFGFFVSITILAALVATLFLLPTLLMIGRTRESDAGDSR